MSRLCQFETGELRLTAVDISAIDVAVLEAGHFLPERETPDLPLWEIRLANLANLIFGLPLPVAPEAASG
jgi:hypothetical protein